MAIVVIPLKAPAVVTFKPELAVKAKVVPASAKAPVALPIVVAAVPVELIKVVPKIVVEPLMAFVPPDTPMMLVADAPVPKVFVREAPVPMVEAPEEVKVVKEPAPPEMAPEPVERLANVAAPALVTCQVEDVPKMSTPAPELEMASTAPEAEA